MYLTEEEAKEKWCPEVRLRVGVNGAANRNLKGCCPDDKDTKCIASGCMMWRYAGESEKGETGYCGKAVLPDQQDNN